MHRILFLLFALTSTVFAQTAEFTRPNLKWQSFETENFVILYTEGLEEVAYLAADIAEEIHKPLCEIYDYYPDTKVSLIFSDEDDIANAGSYFQSNKIKFFATSMAWDFRGTHNWLRNVVTHEYTHMIQLGATRKWSRRFPAIYVQALGYEPERRPDVLYGYPNTLISWPLPSVTVPAWFAEGTAQYQFSGNGYDFWDSHRDMLLRQAVLSNRLLSFEDMGFFGKTSLESEGVYNQGFSFTKYIADHSNGAQTLGEVSRKMGSVWPVTLNDAIASVTGKAGIEWYREWKQDLEIQYGNVRSSLEPFLTIADTLKEKGFVGFYPRFSYNGEELAYVSNSGREYFGQSSLYVYNLASDSSELVAPGVQGGLCWLPDDSGILYAARSTKNPHGALLHDLYVYRFSDKKTIRLSKGLRAESVDLSPDGKTLVFTINEAGRRDLAFAPMPDLNEKIRLLRPEDVTVRVPSLPHEQYYLPKWSPDGERIAVSHHLREGRSVRVFGYNSQPSEITLQKEFDGKGGELRDPSWSADGTSLYVSYDESGIANIYKLDLDSDRLDQQTVVLGGALYPDFKNGKMAFSEFCGDGFRICIADSLPPVRLPRNTLDGSESYLARVPRKDVALRGTVRESESYKPRFESLYWFPRIALDYNKFKPGTYLLLNDVLDKLTFIGGAAVNQDREYDLYGLAEYKEFYPTIFAEYFNVQRRLTSYFADSTRIIGEEEIGGRPIPLFDQYRIRYRYNLNEISVGLGVPLTSTANVKTRATYDQYVAHNRFDDGTSVSLTYFKGWSWKSGFYLDARRPGILTNISPSNGYRGFVEYTRANHKFISDIEVGGDALGLQEIYDPNNYNLLEAGVERYFKSPVKNHSIELRLRGGYMDEGVDPFFYQYAGGLPGMRGYSFYSLGGTRTAVGTLTYRFPVVQRAALNLWPVSLNRVYGSVFADFGDAWTGDYTDRSPKKDIGGGLRFQLHSFYSYPTAVSFDVAYGLDKFDVIEDDVRTSYGEEVRYYLTVLFDFYTPIIPPARHPSSCGCAHCSVN
ncbi:MAG: PD40 domain-containing protein [Calditrichaeota bacterium]|nr:PD40 domain-containing protein [Calditrichota bacterium]MCB9366447.1 PD40 domain-containing protein [Calditrichota bacterium]MCB9391295.1 PD40 domain-containing protein [Calditrichota bacterium]